MSRFPVDAPIERVKRAFGHLGFVIVREGNHVSMARQNPDGTRTTLTIPNHVTLKSSTLRTIVTQAQIPRDEFLQAFERA
jgi:predicted RNA binding protein YcfA (HicA-like mRNA interferase family)